MATSRTGRRPTWSDSDPAVSSAASTARAYTPKTTVVMIGENPHSRWYSAYSGVGAAEPASRETTIDTCKKKAARAGRRPRTPVGSLPAMVVPVMIGISPREARP